MRFRVCLQPMTTSSVADRGLPAAPVLIGVTLLLACLTLLHFHGLPRFQAAGPTIVFLEDGPITLEASDGDTDAARIEITQPLDGVAFVRVEARLAAQGIARGARRWQQGRLVAIQVGRGGHLRLDLPHVVVRLSGDRNARDYRATFRVAPGSTAILLRAEILRTEGILFLETLRLVPLAEMPGFAGGSMFILGCWVLLALLISFWVLRSGVLHQRLRPAFAWLFAAPALFLSVAPAAFTSPLRMGVARNLDIAGMADASGRASEAALSSNLFSLAKAGHVLMFATVGAAFAIALIWRRQPGCRLFWTATGLTACFGLVAEMLQLFSPNRTASLFDVSINLASGTGGVLIATLALQIGSRLRQSRPGSTG